MMASQHQGVSQVVTLPSQRPAIFWQHSPGNQFQYVECEKENTAEEPNSMLSKYSSRMLLLAEIMATNLVPHWCSSSLNLLPCRNTPRPLRPLSTRCVHNQHCNISSGELSDLEFLRVWRTALIMLKLRLCLPSCYAFQWALPQSHRRQLSRL